MGSIIQGILQDMSHETRRNLKTDVRVDTYITAMVKKDGALVGEGIGTVCAFSSSMYAKARCIHLRSEIEVVRE